MKFFIPCDPPRATAQQKKVFRLPNGQIRAVDPKHVTQGKRLLEALFRGHRPQSPIGGALAVTLCYTFQFNTSDSKRARSAGWRWKVTSPDCDNQAKITMDTMTKLKFWNDDNQVARLTIMKRHGAIPGIWVEIKQLRQPYEEADGQEELPL